MAITPPAVEMQEQMEFGPPAPVQINVPQETAPQAPSFAIPLEQADRETFAKAYADEIDRALINRRSVTGSSRFIVSADGTKMTEIQGIAAPAVYTFEDEIRENWDRYELVPPARTPPFDGAANYRTPLTKWSIDSSLSRIAAGTTGTRPIIRVESRPGGDPAIAEMETSKAQKIERFLDYVFEHEINFDEWLDDALLNAGVEGTAIGYLTWDEKREHRLAEIIKDIQTPIVDEEGIAGPPGSIIGIKNTQVSELEERDEVVFQGPRLDLVSLVDFLVADPRRKSLEEQPWVGHRVRLFYPELEALKGKEGYFDIEIDEILKGRGNQYTEGSKSPVEMGVEQRTGTMTVDSNLRMLDWYEVWSLIAWYDWDRDGKPEKVVAEIAMPQRRLIRMIKFPLLHGHVNYIPIRLLPRSNSFYGRALASDLRMTQDEVDAMHNQRTDATSVAIASLFMFLYDEQAGFDPARVRLGLGESIRLEGDINHVKVLADAFRGVNVPGMDIENMLLGFAERLSGISEPQTGKPVEKRATAFEIGAVIQEGNVRFRRMIERVALSIAELTYQIVGLYQQHGHRLEEKFFRVLNDPDSPFVASPTDLAGRWDYRVHGAALASNMDIDARKAMEMLGMAEQSAILQEFIKQDPVRAWTLAKTVIDRIGWPNAEQIIGTKEDAIKLAQMLKQQPPATEPEEAEAGAKPSPSGGGGGPAQQVEAVVQQMLAGGGEGRATPPTPRNPAAGLIPGA